MGVWRVGAAAGAIPIVLVKCWKVAHWNAKKLLKICQHSWRAHVSLVFPSFRCGKHCFQCQRFCFQDANYAHATRQGILTKIRACQHLQKICEHVRVSEHSCNFCEQFEQRPNFASTFKLDGTIRYPFN